MERFHPLAHKEMTLLDLLDGIIDKGVVVSGEILISIADIDLIIVDLKLLISSIESVMRADQEHEAGGNEEWNGYRLIQAK
jgi:gas vesicle structural protein